MFRSRYANVYQGDEHWQKIDVEGLRHLQLARRRRTYIAQPALLRGHDDDPDPGARTSSTPSRSAILGDLDHHRPHLRRRARSRPTARPASSCMEHQVSKKDFNSYGARRGNHEVMMRGTFANIRIKNEMVPGIEGGMTTLRRPRSCRSTTRRCATRPTARRW